MSMTVGQLIELLEHLPPGMKTVMEDPGGYQWEPFEVGIAAGVPRTDKLVPGDIPWRYEFDAEPNMEMRLKIVLGPIYRRVENVKRCADDSKGAVRRGNGSTPKRAFWVGMGTTVGNGYLRDLDLHLAMIEIACAKHALTTDERKEFQEIALLRVRIINGDKEAPQELDTKYEIKDMLATIKCY